MLEILAREKTLQLITKKLEIKSGKSFIALVPEIQWHL
jgi:hypothetical protein